MDVLIRYGLSIEEIKNMMDSNPDISNISDDNINKLINILESINCNKSIIKNIFICNPYSISRSISDINNLINTFKDIGISNINILLDSNPYLLTLSSTDIKRMYNNMKTTMSNDEIIETFNYKSFLL